MTAQTILVTGASSFVGAHLAAKLAQSGRRVVAAISHARGQYEGIREQRLRFAEQHGAEVVELDVRAHNAVDLAVKRHRPDVFVHHAGWVEGYGSYDYDLAKAYEVHTAPLPTIFRALKEVRASGLVLTGTSAEYSDSDAPNREDEACYPAMPYGLSKLQATIRARQLAQQFGIKTRVARVFIPFGPLDTPGKLVPQVIAALLRDETVDLSPGTQHRDFIYVEDLVDGYLRLLGSFARSESFRAYNLCSGIPCAVKDLLREIAGGLGTDESLLRFGARSMREGETPFSCGDNSRARADLGFAPRTTRSGVAAYLAALEPQCD